MTASAVSAIVLAGGASSRFGADKLAAQFAGRPLLERAVEAAAAVASEVIVVLAPGDERALPEASVPVRRAVDPERHGGPLVGLLAGLEIAGEPVVIVVGGDMPTLSPTVLAVLVRALGATDGADAAVLIQRGATRPLPLAVRNGAASQAARRLIGEGERSLRRLLDALSARRLDEVEWRGLDPEGATLRDVDRPEDLAGMPRAGRRT